VSKNTNSLNENALHDEKVYYSVIIQVVLDSFSKANIIGEISEVLL